MRVAAGVSCLLCMPACYSFVCWACLFVCLFVYSFVCLFVCSFVWLLDCLVAWLLGCLVAWLLGCLVAWLLVSCLFACSLLPLFLKRGSRGGTEFLAIGNCQNNTHALCMSAYDCVFSFCFLCVFFCGARFAFTGVCVCFVLVLWWVCLMVL